MKILLFSNLRTEGRKLDDLLSPPIAKWVIRLRWMRKTGHLARTGRNRNA